MTILNYLFLSLLLHIQTLQCLTRWKGEKKVFDLASDLWTIKNFINVGGDSVILNMDSQYQSIRAMQ